MEEKKVPALRFRGFDNAWEQRCLGECFEERNENMPKGELISVTINDGVKRFSELGRHDNSNENKSKYKKVCVGDIPYNSMRMWQGASGYSMYEGIVSPAYTVLKPKEGVNSRCVSYLFKREDMIHTFQLNSQGITSDNWNLKYPKLSQIGIFLPLNLREQEKIVECFVKLDHLISLHQRKLEMLKKVKKSMLEKMFPKNDAKVPEVRFSDFTDAWEQCKFSDVVEIGSGMDYKHLGIGDIPVYGTGGYMLSVDVALSENNDAIGIGRKGTIDKPYILRAPFWTVDTLFYCIPKYNHNLDFTNCLFQNIDWKNKDESTGVPSLSKVIINSIETSIPSYEEQKKIGEYFKSFENLIILHQRKLEKLKNIKKSMLEKMFII